MDYLADDDHSEDVSSRQTTHLPNIPSHQSHTQSLRKSAGYIEPRNHRNADKNKPSSAHCTNGKEDTHRQLGYKSSTWTSTNVPTNKFLDLHSSKTTILPGCPRTSSIQSGHSAGSLSNRRVMVDVSDVASQSTRPSARMYRTDESFTTTTDHTSEYIEEQSDIVDLKTWKPPRISKAVYSSLKDSLLKRNGKFNDRLLKYWRMEKKPWEGREESDDDGYDTDVNEQLGLELLADVQAQAILKDGEFPEYKQECRKFRSNPNSYFLRHCAGEEVCMRHRYLSKGDSITISNQIKNHLTLGSVDLEDNNIGPRGSKYFRNILVENKHLTELNLSCNKLGPAGAKHLASALVTNCYLLKLDISGNHFGDKGGKYCAKIIAENVNLQQLIISNNQIGDAAGVLIAAALAENISLEVLDISWNNLRVTSAQKLAYCLTNNAELQILLASSNGFGDEGAKAILNMLRQNRVIKELDMSSNRLSSAVVKYLSSVLNELEGLHMLHLAGHVFAVKHVLDFLTSLMASSVPLRLINIDGIHVTPELKGLTSALHVVHNIRVVFSEPPSQRVYTEDDLTWNLTMLSEFMEAADIEVEDLFPDYEDDDCDESNTMITVVEALAVLATSEKSIRPSKLKKLRSKLKGNLKRKFMIREWALVYDLVNGGKDPMLEMPLRTHLRRSIQEEREMEAIRAKKKKKGRYGMSIPSVK